MKKIIAVLALTAAVAVATTASSQQPKAKAAPAPARGAATAAPVAPKVSGVGTEPCSTWLSDRAAKNANDVAAEMWVAGFLTSFNHTGLVPDKNITNNNPIGPMANAMDTVCRASPTMTVDTAIWLGLLDLIKTKGYDGATLGAVPPLPRLPAVR